LYIQLLFTHTISSCYQRSLYLNCFIRNIKILQNCNKSSESAWRRVKMWRHTYMTTSKNRIVLENRYCSTNLPNFDFVSSNFIFYQNVGPKTAQTVPCPLEMEFCWCARGRQWCSIIHYYWWTASIKQRLLFSRAGYASWGLSLLSV